MGTLKSVEQEIMRSQNDVKHLKSRLEQLDAEKAAINQKLKEQNGKLKKLRKTKNSMTAAELAAELDKTIKGLKMDETQYRNMIAVIKAAGALLMETAPEDVVMALQMVQPEPEVDTCVNMTEPQEVAAPAMPSYTRPDAATNGNIPGLE